MWRLRRDYWESTARPSDGWSPQAITWRPNCNSPLEISSSLLPNAHAADEPEGRGAPRFVRAPLWPEADARFVRRGATSTSVKTAMPTREYRPAEDFGAVRACLIELQEVERTLDRRVPAGATIADAYLA